MISLRLPRIYGEDALERLPVGAATTKRTLGRFIDLLVDEAALHWLRDDALRYAEGRANDGFPGLQASARAALKALSAPKVAA